MVAACPCEILTETGLAGHGCYAAVDDFAVGFRADHDFIAKLRQQVGPEQAELVKAESSRNAENDFAALLFGCSSVAGDAVETLHVLEKEFLADAVKVGGAFGGLLA